jgi:epoxide hydrolase-like predicted phosphatase
MTAGIEAVLWDFGGVFTQSPFHHLDEYATGLGSTGDVLVDLVLGYHLDDGDHPWHRLERGELSLADAARDVTELAAGAGIEGFDLKAFFATMGGIDGGVHREAMFAVVEQVRASGRRNAVLSNNIVEFSSQWRALLPEGLFDDVVDSSEVGFRKPDPAIFALALERLGGLAPDQAVFLDDHPGNVAAATEIGITAMLVGENPLETASALLSFLGITTAPAADAGSV